ncbi:molybdopterin-dependent oxidoreductase [Deinococcus detaillensis]|uniref:Molybdopterin-dependent oxidoreductase n=1 Tax=Deinococcus detaillensis TaxID=2592048 RepID=A0A553V5N5_9DEIO|nr:molybdopterin-dependent oxidoreductase [Deinococcus detaillensis]TSA87541.1 molybdopterin-dependent oxidoreductase [Deinococcus detaillensis]
MSQRFGIKALAGLLLSAALSGTVNAQSTVADPSTVGAAQTVMVTGAVVQPMTLTLEAVRALPAQSVTLMATAAGKPIQHVYKGALLSDVLKSAQPKFRPEIKNDALRYALLASGRDGYAAVFSWGELDPGFGNRAVLIAYEQDGQPLSALDGPLRLIVPGDGKAGRYVSGLSRLFLLRIGQ